MIDDRSTKSEQGDDAVVDVQISQSTIVVLDHNELLHDHADGISS